jgi:hypothetical protein
MSVLLPAATGEQRQQQALLFNNLLLLLAACCAMMWPAAHATHAYYVFPQQEAANSVGFEAMSITQVWGRTQQTNVTDVYGSTEFFFQNGITGYFGGLAEHTWNATTGKMGLRHTTDFAIWDFCGVPRYGSSPCTAGHKVTSHPLDTVRCARFGGEGTGSHCTSQLQMIRGREYTFHVELAMSNTSGAGWNASVVDEFTGEEHILGSLFLQNTPHADRWLWKTTQQGLANATDSEKDGARHENESSIPMIPGYGGLTLSEPGTTHHAANTTDPVTGRTILLGALSFQEYFNYNDPSFDPEHKEVFYSAFGLIGPRFFPTSSRTSNGIRGVQLRRSRGPRSSEMADAIVPHRIMVDSGGEPPLGVITSGCIPGYPCGGDRVHYEAGPKVISDPAPGTTKWIWNGSKTN